MSDVVNETLDPATSRKAETNMSCLALVCVPPWESSPAPRPTP